MKVAVCVGGLTYPDSIPLMEKLKKKFPNYDFFYGVWKGRENDASEQLGAWSFEEHEPTYHPYLDIDPTNLPPKFGIIKEKMKNKPDMALIPKAPHQTKQILMHSYMLQKLPSEYDMIIRTRYDIDLFDDSINYEQFVNQSYQQNHAIGFAQRFRAHPSPLFNPKPDPKWYKSWDGYLMDLVIMHPRHMFNHKLLQSLHEQKKLLAAEWGWYQILSEPFGSNHQNFFANMTITSHKK